MEPRLVAIAGPLKGQSIPLVDAETILGRDPCTAIFLNDPLVTRKHCAIRKVNSNFQLCDMGSLNGTIVNGTPTHDKVLEHNDRIKIGESQFVFQFEGAEADSVPLTDSFEGELVTTTTVNLN